MPVKKLLMLRVETLETKTMRLSSFECRDSSSGLVAHVEERVEELDSSQKAIIQMVIDLSEDFRAALDVVGIEIVDISARLNLTMRGGGKPNPSWGCRPI